MFEGIMFFCNSASGDKVAFCPQKLAVIDYSEKKTQKKHENTTFNNLKNNKLSKFSKNEPICRKNTS